MSIASDLEAVRTTIDALITEYTDVRAKLPQAASVSSALLPIAYKHIITHVAPRCDQNLLMFVSQYLTTRQPQLASYYATPENRKAMELVRDTLLRQLGDA